MKKGFVALLIVLAIVVLISPALVGRLAEQSMDENLDWAATETQEIVVTSQGFDRGWFSSAGQHRVEIRSGEIQEMLLAFINSEDPSVIPALIIDTRLDHGLIPVSSMGRDEGSLMPGLGSAVSTFSVELDDGSTVPLPGTIYSEVGLTGELRSNFVLEAGSHEFEAANSVWGDTDIEFITNPSSRDVAFDGQVASIAISSEGNFVETSDIAFSGDLRMSRFGVSVGDTETSFTEMTFQNSAGKSTTVGPMKVTSDISIDDDRVTGRTVFKIDNTPFLNFGPANITFDASLLDADGPSVAGLVDAIDQLSDPNNTEDFMSVAEDDVQQLWAHGLKFRIDQLDMELPQGVAALKLKVDVDATDADNFTWTSSLLGVDATTEVSLPVELVNLLTEMDPSYHAAIAGGFLRKNGDVYEIEAAFQKGLLTVNGAPMPIPLSGMQ